MGNEKSSRKVEPVDLDVFGFLYGSFVQFVVDSEKLEWTKLIDFPKLGNKLWTPTNGVLTGMFLVFLDNHFFAVRKQRRMESSVEEQEIKEETVK